MHYVCRTLGMTVLLGLVTASAHAYSAPDTPLIPAPEKTSPMSTIAQYGKFEAAFTIADQHGNPFDPDVNKVDVVFHGPSGATIDVPAFWDGDTWKVRFAPMKPGRYALDVTYNGRTIHPSTITSAAFTCTPSKDPGYIHLDPHDIQRFTFSSGKGYYPIGLNQAWTSHGLPDYPDMFTKMHQNHLNFARIWMTFWDDKALDWAANSADNPKIGEYYLPAARRVDMLMDSAAANDIYVQLCLQHHGQYTAHTDPNWKDNPANAANGGYLKNPQDFFTDATARRLTRAKYRYVVARWGYATHLLSYELFNEVQNIVEARDNEQAVGAWHKEMADTIRDIDYPHHLITTSTADDILKNVGLDYDQVHIYTSNIRYAVAGAGGNRPVFVGEFGPGGGNYGYNEMSEKVLHDGLWSGMTAAAAGGPQFWYWDVVEQKNWWPTLNSASEFYSASHAVDERHLARVHSTILSNGALGDLAFTLPEEWRSTSQSDIEVTADGSIPDIGGVSGFIQGSNHRDMMPKPLSFHVDSKSGTTFSAKIDVAARAGAHAVLLLDGNQVADVDYPRTTADRQVTDILTASVPAGKHVITLENTGFDWYKATAITLTHYAPASPYAVEAKGNDHFALFWLTSTDGTAQPASAVKLSLPNLKNGRYKLHLWATSDGKPVSTPQPIDLDQGIATVSLPPVTPDIAGWISRD
jgi:hypothetical protein